MIRLLTGDCRATLPMLEAGSVQSVVTSPPYWGLRDYGTPPLVWGGDAEHAHEWGGLLELDRRHVYKPGAAGMQDQQRAAGVLGHLKPNGQYCACGAWLGSLGLEPTPELYIEHLVDVFGEVRRVLRDDGVLWLNLGDSYAGSGKGPTGHNGIGDQVMRQGFRSTPTPQGGQMANRSVSGQQLRVDTAPGAKAKDLLMVPFRAAEALKADGWYLRSVVPWLKRNSMPESVADRPGTSLEYVFLLSKSARYFWDADAVRMPAEYGRRDWKGQHYKNGDITISHMGTTTGGDPSAGRNRRNSDWFFESWQGLMLDDDGDPLALVVNPAPFSGAHFATFPPKLVEPMVKASTRPGDTVLDPFGGAGTTGMVADRLGRNAVLCELKADYAAMGTARLVGDAPLFVEMEG